jgi:2'-hydroxyisoflavone reductase
VSSRSVYGWPVPSSADEAAPVVDARSDDESEEDYAVVKRGGELAVLETFGDRALIARPGLILGPYENVGRLPWWLRRIERGGQVLAPGPRDRAIQYIDARDLAAWMLGAADRNVGGMYNTVSQPDHTTMGELLDTCVACVASDAELVWVTPETIEEAGIEPWTELPIWLPPTGEMIGLHDGVVAAAFAQGLTCRPVQETVADTWAWLQREGDQPPPAARGAAGLDPEREQQVLASLRGRK